MDILSGREVKARYVSELVSGLVRGQTDVVCLYVWCGKYDDLLCDVEMRCKRKKYSWKRKKFRRSKQDVPKVEQMRRFMYLTAREKL